MNGSAFNQRSNDLDEICGERSGSTIDFPCPPVGQPTKLIGDHKKRARCTPCICGSSLLGDRNDLPLRKRDIAGLESEGLE